MPRYRSGDGRRRHRATAGRPAPPAAGLNGRPGPRKEGWAAGKPQGKFPDGRGGGQAPSPGAAAAAAAGHSGAPASHPVAGRPAGGGQPFSRALPPSLPGLLLFGGGARQPGAVTAAELLLLAPLGGHGRGPRRVRRVAGRPSPPEVAAPAPPRGPGALRPAHPRHYPRPPREEGPAGDAAAGARRRAGGQAAAGGAAAAASGQRASGER